MSDRVRVLYVAGMPRSGSTLLDLMLGQVPGHCDVGELYYLFTSGVRRDILCSCGERFSSCPFWTEVGRRAFGGWDALDVDEVLGLQAAVDRTSRMPAVLVGRYLPRAMAVTRRAAERYVELLVAVYRAAGEVSGREVVVDSTKRPSLALLLALDPRVDLRLVHLVRDPRGVVFSWSRAVELPAGAGPRARMKQRSAWQITRRWVTVNLMHELLRAFGVPGCRIRYEDLVTRPRQVLATVAAVSRPDALTGATDPYDFVQGDNLEMRGGHTVAGGRVRLRTGVMELRLDDRWRSGLRGTRRRAVDAVTAPLRRWYGYR